MRKRLVNVLFISLLPLVLSGMDTAIPETVRFINFEPYRFNGMLATTDGVGSASMVAEGVFATAAHVIYDEKAMAWEPVGDVSYYPRYNRITYGLPVGSPYSPVAFMRWTSYSSRVEDDGTGDGFSSIDTFNIDFAVGYIGSEVEDEAVLAHPEVSVDPEGAVGILRDQRDKMIVGYPTDSEYIGRSERGLMHRTPPGNYFCWWDGLTDFPNTWRDSEHFWVATYDFEGVTTYGGNSGGPIYARDDAGEWIMAGVVVGSDSNEGVLIRGIDTAAWQLIEAAVEARGAVRVRRVEDLAASATSPGSVELNWSDHSGDEAAFVVYRKDTGSWERLADLPADSTAFIDDTVRPGHVYAYRVQPLTAEEYRPPKSPVARINTPGENRIAGESLGDPWLAFRNTGDSNWHLLESNLLRAGRVRSMGSSTLSLDLIGPGTLAFTWSASCEENPDYATPSSPNSGEIYDAVHFALDGVRIKVDGEPVFLSGFKDPESRSIAIPPGPHTVEWTYEKDPYSDEGEDTAFLHSLEWQPAASNPYPVYGAFAYPDSDWNGSLWLGAHNARDLPWIAHPQLGWLYLRPGNGTDLFLHAPIQGLGELYTRPGLFPFLYDYSRGGWLYYLPGTGNFGARIWFYDLAAGEWFSS